MIATKEQNELRDSSGNFTILTAIHRASFLLSNFAGLSEVSSPPLTLGFWCDERHSV
jgi:hypothetical protein